MSSQNSRANSSLKLETRFPLPELPEKLQRGRPGRSDPKPDLCVKLGPRPTQRRLQDEVTIDMLDGVVKSPGASCASPVQADRDAAGPLLTTREPGCGCSAQASTPSGAVCRRIARSSWAPFAVSAQALGPPRAVM